MAWRVYAAAAIGSSHIEGGIPCQDAFAHAVDGERLLAVVCDGAGSQPLSHIGAQTLSRRVVELLADEQIEPVAGNAQLELVIGETIAQARAELRTRAEAEGVELSSFACTLVGAMANAQAASSSMSVMASAWRRPTARRWCRGRKTASTPTRPTSSAAPSGASTCASPISAATPRRIALMSDGAMPFAMAKGNGELFKPFMDPVESLPCLRRGGRRQRRARRHARRRRTHGITSDDKTLLIALWR
jgi:hypothetical protein